MGELSKISEWRKTLPSMMPGPEGWKQIHLYGKGGQ